MNEKPTKADLSAAHAARNAIEDDGGTEDVAAEIARHMAPEREARAKERELLRELSSDGCWDFLRDGSDLKPCEECWPCRARKLIQENEA